MYLYIILMGCVATRREITVQSLQFDKNYPLKELKEASKSERYDAHTKMPENEEAQPSIIHIQKFISNKVMSNLITNVNQYKSKTLDYRTNTHKMLSDLCKVEGFEWMMKGGKSSEKRTGNEALLNMHNNFTMFPQNQADEETFERGTVRVSSNKLNSLHNNNDNINKLINLFSRKDDEEFLHGQCHLRRDESNLMLTTITQNNDENYPYRKIASDSCLHDEKDKLNKSNLTEQKISNSSCERKKGLTFTDYTRDRTFDGSVIEEKSPHSSPSYVTRKFNINPYNNLHVIKKYFIYQLKKSFLQAKKCSLNTAIHGQQTQEANANYHEIFANYSQICTTAVNSYVKYEDQNVQINNYFIKKDRTLGKGGFSTVYLCTNLTDKQEYAAKITQKTVRANALMRKYDYVKDEVRVLKRIYSKYIVKTFEVMETKSECLIFMELMKNSLFNIVNKLSDFQVWRYFRNLICGVEHCHDIAKIVHRDININNLLVSDEGILKLSDFGVSIITEDDDLISVNSGPTTYTPPEKKYNSSSHYNGKPADIWSCGVTLFHMVYKRPPFKNCGSPDIQDYTIKFPEAPIDSDLRDLLIRLLEVNPKTRCSLNEVKKHPWVTKNGEFPLPDIHEEALEYVYSLTTKEIRGYTAKEEPDVEDTLK